MDIRVIQAHKVIEYMFSWIGAAVDISHRVHKQLALLGPKLYFFRLPRSEETEEYYLSGRGGDFAEKKKAIQAALIDYLSLFEANPQIVRDNELLLSKIPVNLDADDLSADRYIIRFRIIRHLSITGEEVWFAKMANMQKGFAINGIPEYLIVSTGSQL